MVRITVIAGSLLLIVAIGMQAYRLSAQERDLAAQVEKLEVDAEALTEENARIHADLEYYGNAENLMKEFRSLFNYRRPGEELHIIVPRQ